MHNLGEALATYVAETRKLNGSRNSTETSFYPDVKLLLTALLKSELLPFDVITGTSEARSAGRDMPDFVLGDTGNFVALSACMAR